MKKTVDTTKNLKPWKKGQSGNPSGGPKLPEDLRKAATLTKTEALEKLVAYLRMDIHELEAVLKDKSRKVMDHWVARVCLIGIKEGDYKRLEFMFDRILGKVQPNLEITQNNYNFEGLPKEKVIELGREAIKFLESEDP